jgi:uncharacterized RDD family membrane protein YckC
VLLVIGIALYRAGVPYGARLLLTGAGAIAYNGLMDGGPTGQTIGKRLLKVRVVDDDTGGPLGQNRGLGRAAVTYVLGFAALSPVGLVLPILDGLWPLWDQKRQTWHDKVVRSVVVVA